jgi:hypothetical protein
MSQRYSTVVIFRSGQWQLAQVLSVLAPVLQPGDAERQWETQPLDVNRVLVPDLAKVIPGMWSWFDEPALGHAAAVWTPSANSVHHGEDEGMAVIDQYLSTALDQLSPAFEYFSVISDYAERPWLEKVFAELGRSDWKALLEPAYERMMLPPHLADSYIDRPRWQVVAVADAGVLVQTRSL